MCRNNEVCAVDLGGVSGSGDPFGCVAAPGRAGWTRVTSGSFTSVQHRSPGSTCEGRMPTPRDWTPASRAVREDPSPSLARSSSGPGCSGAGAAHWPHPTIPSGGCHGWATKTLGEHSGIHGAGQGSQGHNVAEAPPASTSLQSGEYQ